MHHFNQFHLDKVAKHRARGLKSLDTLPLIFLLRIAIGLVITLTTIVLKEDFEMLVRALVIVPYLPFVISLILFFKKKLAFRMWYIVGAIPNLLFAYYTSGFPMLLILVEVLIFTWMFTSFKKSKEE